MTYSPCADPTHDLLFDLLRLVAFSEKPHFFFIGEGLPQNCWFEFHNVFYRFLSRYWLFDRSDLPALRDERCTSFIDP